MSFLSRLVHHVTIVRVAYGGSDDTYGQPTASETSVQAMANVQPKAGDEAPDSRSAGAGISDHVVFLPLSADVQGSDHIVWHRPDRDNLRLQVVTVRAFEFGRSPHLEVDCRAITTALVGAGS